MFIIYSLDCILYTYVFVTQFLLTAAYSLAAFEGSLHVSFLYTIIINF